MPRATADTVTTEKKDLKSVEGGFVQVRRLSYGEKLERRAMVSGMKIEATKGKSDFAGEMQLVSEQATLYDFQKCIVDHNLTKPNPADPTNEEADIPLNFTSIGDVKSLDPRIGEEIDDILSTLNNFEDEEGN